MYEDELGGGLNYDDLFLGYQISHLRELINDHEETVIPMLG
jgi:hypothetical protein